MDVTSYLLGKKAGGSSTPVLQDKEVTITQNGESTVTKDSGYDGLGTVSITTNVPQPSGKITIIENGTDIDVSSYASADVIVSTGGSTVSPTSISFSEYTGSSIDLSNIDTSRIRIMTDMFSSCSSLTSLDLSGFDTTSVDDVSFIFYGCTSLTFLDVRTFEFSNLISTDDIFGANYDISSKVPANCEIIVKDNTQKTWVTTNYSWLTNVKTVAEYEAE